MSEQWYFLGEGVTHGPVSTAQLKQLAAAGMLHPDDQVQKVGMQKWVAASSVKGLFPALAKPSSEEAREVLPTKSEKPGTVSRAPRGRSTSSLRDRRVIVAACAAGLLIATTVVVVASRGRTPEHAANEKSDEQGKAAHGSGHSNLDGSGKLLGSATDGGGGKSPSGQPSPPKLAPPDKGVPEKRPVTDVPLPAFDKSAPPNSEFDFSKLDYTKGPNGEPLRAVDGVDRDPNRLTADGGVPVGKNRVHVFVNKQGRPVQHGVETHWFMDGTKSQELYWWNGQRHGTVRKWHENGTLGVEGVFVNEKPHGVGRTFHSNGKKSSEMTFVNGVMTGYAAKWYEDGSLSFEGMSKDGKKHGPLVEYYPGGQRRAQKTYANDAEDGDAYGWYKSGQLQWRQTSRNGKLVGIETNWNKHGQVAYELDWGDGKTTPTVVRRYNWSSATKEELKDTIVDMSQANVVNPGKVFQATLKTKTFEQAFGKPDSDAGAGDERLWTFRCRDGAITFRVVTLGAGVTQFKKIERE